MGLSPSGLIRVVFPFDPVTQAQLRKITPRGVWTGRTNGWEFPLSAGNSLREILGGRFQVEEDLAKLLDLASEPRTPYPSHELLMKAADLNLPLLDGRMPYRHQCSGAAWLMRKQGALLADEMGLGKTLTALLAARGITRSIEVAVVVIAPVGLHSHWLEEARAIDISIELISWAKLPSKLPDINTLLIVDEAHFAQNLHTKRTQAFLRLARHPLVRAVWLLTGTPIKNGNPIQLFPMLAAIGHPMGLNKHDFESKFCGNYISNKSSDRFNKSFHKNTLKDLRYAMDSYILCRTKADLLCLPPKLNQDHNICLSPSEKIGFDYRVSLILEDYRYKLANGFIKSDAESLVVLTAIRMISTEYKLPALYDFLLELLDKKEPVVVFSCFINPLLLLHQSLKSELLIGQTPIHKRSASIKNFQSGKSLILLTTYGTGGLGFNFNEAKHVVLLDRPWTPGDVAQAEDRCHRLCKLDELKVHWFKLGFVDQIVDQILISKSKNINIFLGSRSVKIKRQNISKMFKDCVNEI